MKITGTRSYMIVEFTDGEFAGKKVKIEGELTLTPAFYAVKGSIKNWEAPYENDRIKDDDKKQIVEQILEHNNPDFKIVFED
jgi:hypothetical protein